MNRIERDPPAGLPQVTLAPGALDQRAAPLPEGPLKFEVIAVYAHDPDAFTQGLVWADGTLYESTGLYGHSTVRRIDLQTGETTASATLDDRYFGEGLELVGDQLVQLTLKSQIALICDTDTLALVGWLPYEGDGWGLCQLDTDTLVTSDGSDTLTFRNATTFEPVGTINITDNGEPVDQINELECVGHDIWANVWQTDTIIRIDSTTGRIRSTLDTSDQLRANEPGDAGVLNGIAYLPERQSFLLTGKNWANLYEILIAAGS